MYVPPKPVCHRPGQHIKIVDQQPSDTPLKGVAYALPSSIINLTTHNTTTYLFPKRIKKSTMENLRNGQENGSHWIPFTFFDQSSVTIPLLKCFGLDSSSSSSSSSGDFSSSHSEEDESIDIKEEEEEEDDMTIEIKARGKTKTKPQPSSGKGGKHN